MAVDGRSWPFTIPSPDSRRAWLTAGLLTLCYTLSLVDRFILSFLAEPMRRDLDLTDFQLGLLQGFAFSIVYAVAGIPLGWAVDRFSRARIIAVAVAFWSLMTAFCGMARGFVDLLAARIGVGGSEAALTPAAYSILSQSFDRDNLPRASTLYSLGPTAAMALAGAISALVLGTHSARNVIVLPWIGPLAPWRATLILAAAPGILVAALALFVIREMPRPQRSSSQDSNESYLFGFRGPLIWAFMLVSMLGVLAGYALSSWNPSVLAREFHWNGARIGATMGFVAILTGTVATVLGGAVCSWCMKHRRVRTIFHLCAVAMATLAVCGMAIPFARNGASYLVISSVAAAIAPLIYLIAPTTLQLMVPPEVRGRATALLLLICIGVGAGGGPSLVGAMNTLLFHQAHLLNALGIVVTAAGVFGALGFGLLATPLQVRMDSLNAKVEAPHLFV